MSKHITKHNAQTWVMRHGAHNNCAHLNKPILVKNYKGQIRMDQERRGLVCEGCHNKK